MTHQTHYAALGLAPHAPVTVIKAAYKALALAHHPDKTIDQSASERAEHSAIFRAVQEAYDVLSNPTQKAMYDAELERNGNRVDPQRSTFHHSSSRTSTGSSASHYRSSPAVHLTTPEIREAKKAEAARQLAQLQAERAKRDQEDAAMDLAGLKHTLKIWKDMAEENRADATIHAYCLAQGREYELKIRARTMEREDWLNNLSSPKCPAPPVRNVQKKAPVSTYSTQQAATRAANRVREEQKRADEQAEHLRNRMAEKRHREDVKRAQQEAKAAAVRRQRDDIKRKADEARAKEQERIKRARVKAGVIYQDSFAESQDSLVETLDNLDITDLQA